MPLSLLSGGSQQLLVSRSFAPTSASFFLCVSHLLLFLVKTRVTGSGANPMGDRISRSLNLLHYEDSISKEGHGLGCWGLGFGHILLG